MQVRGNVVPKWKQQKANAADYGGRQGAVGDHPFKAGPSGGKEQSSMIGGKG
jgi:hypothetical protein